MRLQTSCFRGFTRGALCGVFCGVLFVALFHSAGCSSDESGPTSSGGLDRIQLPEGFSISYFADGIPGARSLVRSPEGTLFVGTRSKGRVYAVRDDNEDGIADAVHLLAEGLHMPNGVAFRDGSLYIAEVNRILRLDDIENQLEDPPSPVVVRDDLPTETHHGWKFIAFGPDGKLYVPIGAPCNVCDEEDERFSSICRMNADGTEFEVFAHGVRNTVGFDWDPKTGELWFTDNGRDWLGDNSPPDELNHAPEAGLHFGFPYCHGGDRLDPDFGAGRDCDDYRPPAQKLGPHVAALGMRFYDGSSFPSQYQGQIFIAEHGSWNRSSKIGYRIMLVRRNGNEATTYEPFAEGWLQGEDVWGRPVDVLVLPDGSMLVSDDYAGAIYRIQYTG